VRIFYPMPFVRTERDRGCLHRVAWVVVTSVFLGMELHISDKAQEMSCPRSLKQPLRCAVSSYKQIEVSELESGSLYSPKPSRHLLGMLLPAYKYMHSQYAVGNYLVWMPAGKLEPPGLAMQGKGHGYTSYGRADRSVSCSLHA
jgi:hypothetical protein